MFSSEEKTHELKFSKGAAMQHIFYVAQYIDICPGRDWKSLRKEENDKTSALTSS